MTLKIMKLIDELISILKYYTTHDGWDITGYQYLFCPSNKHLCDW